MASIRLFSFLLVFILVLLGESSAHSQVVETILATDGSDDLQPARKNLAKLGKEAYDAVPAAAGEVWNSRLEGRKLTLKWALDKKKTVTVVEGSDGEKSAKISGADYQSVGKRKVTILTNANLNNQIGSSQEKFKYQDDRIRNMFKANLVSSATASPDQPCFRYIKPVSDKGSSGCFSSSPKLVPQESDNSPQKLQSQKLLGAAKELTNFMNEDYIKTAYEQ